MPPRTRITRDMIVEAAAEAVRACGPDGINARSIAERLGCSTQPVMYHFSTIGELKRAAYERISRLHTEWLLRPCPDCDPMLQIGLQYVRFAHEEPNWFRFLFQSGTVPSGTLADLTNTAELDPVIDTLRTESGLGEEAARNAFATLALCTHGYASLVANGALPYDEADAARRLELAFLGAAAASETTNGTGPEAGQDPVNTEER